MQNRFRLLAGLMIVSSVVAGCERKGTDEKEDSAKAVAGEPAFDKAAAEAEIRSGDSAFFSAVRAKDANGVANTYSDDAVSMPPNSPAMRGREAIRKGNEDFMKTPGFTMVGGTETIKFSADGGMAYATGKYTATYTDAKGKPVTEEGKYLEVLEKVDGKWKVVADAYNANAAPKM